MVDTSGYLVYHGDFITRCNEDVEYVHIAYKVWSEFHCNPHYVNFSCVNDRDIYTQVHAM